MHDRQADKEKASRTRSWNDKMEPNAKWSTADIGKIERVVDREGKTKPICPESNTEVHAPKFAWNRNDNGGSQLTKSVRNSMNPGRDKPSAKRKDPKWLNVLESGELSILHKTDSDSNKSV